MWTGLSLSSFLCKSERSLSPEFFTLHCTMAMDGHVSLGSSSVPPELLSFLWGFCRCLGLFGHC